MEKISVIIPAYNVEKYIRKTLDSILDQTYTNIEILIINDGSKDKTDEIIKEYQNKYKNIIYKSRKNKGAMFTRKEALNYATGEYVMFVDGDDWIEKDCLKNIMIENEKYNSDIIRFLYVKDLEKQNRKIYLKSPYKENIYIPKEKFYKEVYPLVCETYFYNSMCCQLIKKSLIDSDRINTDYIMGEDLLFNLDLLTNARSIFIINECYYHYVYNDSSVTTNSDINIRKKSIQDVNKVYSNLIDYAKKWNVEYLNENIYNRILREYTIQLKEIIISNNKISYNDFKTLIEGKFIKDYRKKINKVKGLNNKLLINEFYFILFIKEKYTNKIKCFIKNIIFR